VFFICVAVVFVCILAVSLSLVTMYKNDVEEVPEALLKVAKGNVRFTTSLFKVSNGC
jgi:hypothetical protein